MTTPNRSALFACASAILARHAGAGSAATIAETLTERERLASTALGHAVAIPHARIKGLSSPCAAVIRLREPLGFGAPDDQPTYLFVFLLVRERATQDDLDTLAQIAEMISERAVREQLMQAPDAHSVYAAIARWSPSHRD